MNFDYDRHIADAARAWVEAHRAFDLKRDEATCEAFDLAQEKLCWMVDAERHGWDPDDFRPGC